jgi:hypothetical protein
MKSVTLVVLSLMSLVAGVARADYQCANVNEGLSLSINENYISDLGDTRLLLESADGKSDLFGNMRSDEGNIFKKKVVEIYPFKGETLTIVFVPKLCGRKSCDVGAGEEISATLKIGDNQTYLSCYETNF